MESWKKVILFAIIPAFIAGIFSIAPKAYDIVMQPKANLEYKITEGPGLELNGKWRKVVSINNINSGKLTLKNLQSELVIKNGIIEASTVNDNIGLNPNLTTKPWEINVQINNLHPSENFSVSAMVLLDNPNVDMVFNIRSDEVRGLEIENEPPESNKKMDLLSAFLAGFSVFIMAILMLLSSRTGKGLFPLTLILGSKQDALFYITVRNNITTLSDHLKLSNQNLSYLHTADIFLAEGLKESIERRVPFINALKCLLLVKNIAEKSMKVVIRNISILEDQTMTEKDVELLRSNAVDVDDVFKFREKIEDYLANKLI